jgi:hypothetical protein
MLARGLLVACACCSPLPPLVLAPLQDVSSLKDFFETNLDLACPDALMGMVGMLTQLQPSALRCHRRRRLAPPTLLQASAWSLPGAAGAACARVDALFCGTTCLLNGQTPPNLRERLHPPSCTGTDFTPVPSVPPLLPQIDNMTGRRSSGLPPALMHGVELDRVIVGDGSGEATAAGAVIVGDGWGGGWGGASRSGGSNRAATACPGATGPQDEQCRKWLGMCKPRVERC